MVDCNNPKVLYLFTMNYPQTWRIFPLTAKMAQNCQFVWWCWQPIYISLHYLSRGTGSLDVLLDFASLAMLCTTHNGFKFFFLSINYFVYLHFQDIILRLRQTAWQPYSLSHINCTYSPIDQSLKFSWKILRIGGARKWHFVLFLVIGLSSFWLLGCPKDFFLIENDQMLSFEVAFVSALWMVSSESWKRLYPN